MIEISQGDNLALLMGLDAETIDLVYTDPPFNTGQSQVMDRTRNYGERISRLAYDDIFTSQNEYLNMLYERLTECWRVLKPTGTIAIHLDAREVHYVKVMCDLMWGRDKFLNEIIWAFDYGGRSKVRFSPKHNTILVYVKDPKKYIFNYNAVERIPYMAPELVGPIKAARGKTITDTWWHTIVPTQGAERTGYPNQKPVGIVRRFVEVFTNENAYTLDIFAGSGVLGEAAAILNRHAILFDQNPQAIRVMQKRFTRLGCDWKVV